jgi:hypothetical protein
MMNSGPKAVMAQQEGDFETEADFRNVNSVHNQARSHPISPDEPKMKITGSIVIACACLSLLSGKSFAGPAKATVLIDNQSGRKVVYEYKWGGEWKVDNLQRGENVTYEKRYNPQGVAPLYIRFATAGGIDGGVNKTYRLYTGFDNQPQRYRFEVKNNKVDLIRVTGGARKSAQKRGQRIDDN